MKNKLLPLIAAWLIAHWAQDLHAQTKKSLSTTLKHSHKEQQKHIPKTKIVYKNITITSMQKDIIEKTIAGYTQFYNCWLKEITITTDTTFVKKRENDKTITVESRTRGQVILFDPKNFSHDINKLENIILHELFHTLKPKQASAIIPCLLQDGYTMTGYHGLSIDVENWDIKTKFWSIEDAAAEACAYGYKENYSVQAAPYVHIWLIMVKMVRQWWITYEDLIQAQKTNDVSSLCTKIYQRPVDTWDVEDLISIFSTVAANNDDLSDRAISTLTEKRK